ncbi:MAG: RNA-binding cell elongation regulator Jag/EloR [Candidatus Howiella sp.]
MVKEAIGTGETIEEAKENALLLLGSNITTDIDFEVLETPKKKTFGLFGGCPAKVRVFTELPDPKPAKSQKPAEKAEKSAAPAQKKPAVQKTAPKREETVKKPVAPMTQKAEKTEPAEVEEQIIFVPASEVSADSPAGRAVAYLSKVFAAMEVPDVAMRVGEIEGGYRIDLDGGNLGVVIGRRGETLDALQYLASLAANNGGGYTRIVLNTGNYREKREQTLQGLARRMSSQVLRTGRSRTLEPMNPYERRIIHTAVQKIDGVTSNSVGDGAGRRVVISPTDGVRPAGGKGGYNGGRPRSGFRNGNGGRDRRDGRRDDRRSSAVSSAASRPPKSDVDDRPLYGKIDLNK